MTLPHVVSRTVDSDPKFETVTRSDRSGDRSTCGANHGPRKRDRIRIPAQSPAGAEFIYNLRTRLRPCENRSDFFSSLAPDHSPIAFPTPDVPSALIVRYVDVSSGADITDRRCARPGVRSSPFISVHPSPVQTIDFLLLSHAKKMNRSQEIDKGTGIDRFGERR